MGLSYNPKPAFIETLIEAGSAHFLLGVSLLFAFAADYELAGGQSRSEDAAILTKAEREFALAGSNYDALLASIRDLPVVSSVREQIKRLTSSPAPFTSSLVQKVLGTPRQVDDVLRAAASGDPKKPVEEFTAKLKALETTTAAAGKSVRAGKFTPQQVQGLLSLAIDAYLYGQFIAEFNRLSREEFASAG